MSPESEFAYRAEPLRCHACKAVAYGTERFTRPPNEPSGLFISVTKTRGAHG